MHKSWRGGGEFVSEKCTIDSYAYKPCYFSGRIYIDLGPWHWDFCNIFLPNTGEDQQKVLPFERGAHGTVPYVKSVPGYCITFMKG